MDILSLFAPAVLAPTQSMLDLILESPTVLLYVGPDQILPFASVLSAIAGIALVFWNRLLSVVGLCWSLITGRGRVTERPPQPASGAETGK